MKAVRICILAFLAGVVLASCNTATGACLPLEFAPVDTLGWVVVDGDTIGPITARASCGVVLA